MAEKHADKELTVEERLQALYRLQTLLSEVDRIRIIRGELPEEVKDLEDEIVMFQTRIQKFKDEIEEQKKFIDIKKGEIEERKMKIARYDSQIDNVRNNREFAFLEKEREFETLEIQLAEKKINEARNRMEEKEGDIARAEQELSDRDLILEDKKRELQEIIAETRTQEENLLVQAKELEGSVDPRTLSAFKRIRKNARNGLGIVTVQRNACGGCFNRIPPQRQLEIKMHKKVIVCEYCGRIMIDSALAGIPEETPAAAPAPKKKSLRKPK